MAGDLKEGDFAPEATQALSLDDLVPANEPIEERPVDDFEQPHADTDVTERPPTDTLALDDLDIVDEAPDPRPKSPTAPPLPPGHTVSPESPSILERLVARAREPDVDLEATELAALAEGARDKSVRARWWHELGELLEEVRESEAIAAYGRALAADPGYRPTLWSLRRVLTRRGLWDNLGKLIDAELKVATDAAERADLWVERAAVHDRMGEPEAAKQAIEEALAADGAHLLALSIREADLALDGTASELGQVWRDLADASSDPGRKVVFLCDIADQRLAEGDARGACEVYAEAWALDAFPEHVVDGWQEADPDSTAAAEARVDVLMQRIRAGVEVTGQLVLARRRLARCYRRDGRDAEAWTVLEEALGLETGDIGVLKDMARLGQDLGYDEAVAHVAEALREHPDNPSAHDRKLWADGDWVTMATERMQAGLYRDAGHLWLYRADDPARAAEAFGLALEADAQDERAARGLHVAALLAGDPASASAALERVLELEPASEHGLTRLTLADAYAVTGHADRAHQILEAAAGDDDARAHAEWALFENQCREGADPAGEPPVAADPFEAEARLHAECVRARAELAQGRIASAGRILAEVIDEAPHHREALLLLRRAARGAGDWETLARVCLRLAAAFHHPETQARFYAQAAQLVERELGRPENAAPLWRMALDRQRPRDDEPSALTARVVEAVPHVHPVQAPEALTAAQEALETHVDEDAVRHVMNLAAMADDDDLVYLAMGVLAALGTKNRTLVDQFHARRRELLTTAALPGRDITKEEWATVMHPGARVPATDILRCLAPAMAYLAPHEPGLLGFAPGQKVPADQMGRRYPLVAGMLDAFGLPTAELYVSSARGGFARALPFRPLVLFLGADVAMGQSPVARFALARAVAEARDGTGALSNLRDHDLYLSLAACFSMHGGDPAEVEHLAPATDDPAALDMRVALLDRHLDRRDRRRLGELVPGMRAPFDAARWRFAMTCTAYRGALLLTGDAETAVVRATSGGEDPGDSPEAHDLVHWGLSGAHVRLRKELGI